MHIYGKTGHKVRQLGQGMSEYLIIVGLVAVCSIGVFGFFGDTIKNQVAAMSRELAGQDSSTEIKRAEKASKNASTKAAKENRLSNFSENNH
jgi:Flp pilus assembly pilin Flp